MSIQIDHHREGEGPPLVLLHGVGLRWQVWRPVIGELARDFDVIACDSPGFGGSPPLPAGMAPTIGSYADAFEWFFAELGIERPHLAGNSMGGGIALELARRRAAGSVCAISPVGFWTATERRFCQASLYPYALIPPRARGALQALARNPRARVVLLKQIFARPERVPVAETLALMANIWESPVFTQVLDAFSAYDFERPEELRGRAVTIAWGDRDYLLPYRLQAPRARRMLPEACHVTLGAGHVPTWDDPPAVAAAIRACAQRAAPAPAGRD